MLVAQISDCHIVDPGDLFVGRIDSAGALRRAIETIHALTPRPDLVIGTGDLVNDGSDRQYDHFEALIALLDVPFVPIPGNHDDRTQLRRRFAHVLPAGGADDPIDVVVDLDGVRLVALDTTIPGSHEGRLTEAQLTWLDARLAEAPDVPTIVAQHHPPVASGVRSMDDACGFADGGAEADVLRRHSHVEAVLSGHLHRAFHRRYAGTISTTAPSTACQLELRLNGGDTTYSSEPTGFLLHDWRPGVGLVTHVVPTGSFDTWSPPWAG